MFSLSNALLSKSNIHITNSHNYFPKQKNYLGFNVRFYNSNTQTPHWLTNSKGLEKNFFAEDYFKMPHFGTAFSSMPLSTKEQIERKQCRLYTEEETKKHLMESKTNALNQQEEKRRIVKPFDLTNQSTISKIINYLFMGPTKPVFSTVNTTSLTSKLDIECERFADVKAVVASSIGRRSSMEDTHVATKFDLLLGGKLETIILTAVFDGHGGSECSEFVAKNLVTTIKAYLELFNTEQVTDRGIVNALNLSLVDLSHAFNPQNSEASAYHPKAGCTANIVMQIGNESIFVVNCGDSRAILIDAEGKGHQISEDAVPEEPRFTRYIYDVGGDIVPVNGKLRVQGILAVPRSLGDHWSQGVVPPLSEIIKLEGKDFDAFNNFNNCKIVQCCDGVFEVSTTEDVTDRINYSKELTLEEKAMDVIKAAYICDSSDNLSVLIRTL